MISKKVCEIKGERQMGFEKEADFEEALIQALTQNGWEKEIIKYPTEQDLIRNWADILFENNRDIDRLNDCPLNDAEMQELMEQIKELKTPLKLNGFINGKTVAITRMNPEDKLHYGKEVSLKIYDRMEIAAGQSRYQIVEQPQFPRHEKVLQDRRGDIMLLINGMPVFHIELKKSGIPVSEACNQIVKYAHEGVFTGLFSLVQVFVAMNPEETLYFANPGPEGKFKPDFYFHWADFNNEPVNDWKSISSTLLSIPMAHQLIGFYTVADDSDGVLKVMRSYQYYAANKISDQVSKTDWSEGKQLGGYIWHTTGSGKTMTSFKSAQLIANSKDADKVIFLMDRIELGTQSLKEYRAFADNIDDVQDTEDTIALIGKLKSNNPKDTLIVTSIQKMSNIKDDAAGKMRLKDLEDMQSKRLVFIVDECHRSTFGEMLISIKHTFPKALFFGFTGTPIFDENQKLANTTATVFGNELHRYSIADGIRDKNVLGFDPCMVMVYKDKDVRQQVALLQAKAKSVKEVLADPEKEKKYYYFMDEKEVPMAGEIRPDGKILHGIEDYIPRSQYETDDYQNAVVEDIKGNWMTLSRGNKFHAIFATSSIPEAVQYYKKIRQAMPELKVTALFDPSIDNNGKKSLDKEDGIKEMLEDYKQFYGQQFDIAGYDRFKKDVAARLAHKRPYERIKEDQQLDLLIVVNQMLTGFDSKWINTLYLDKLLVYQNLIQAFSRTNRLFDIHEKPFGTIRYYRYPHTMKCNIENAVKLYSGDKPRGLFADHLVDNLKHMNLLYEDIVSLFKNAEVPNFDKLPADNAAKGKFASLFRDMCMYMQASMIQEFSWDKSEYESQTEDGPVNISIMLNQRTYETLLQRYKELRDAGSEREDGTGEEVAFDLDPYLTDLNTGRIDNDYMNSRFEKYLKELDQPEVDEKTVQETLAELHKSFASLSQEEQKYANLFLHDVQTGDVLLERGKKFRDYIVTYQENAKNDQIHKISMYLGCDENLLRDMMRANVTEQSINEFGRFDALKNSVNKEKAKAYFEALEQKKVPLFRVNNRAEELLRKFILSDGMDIPVVGARKEYEEKLRLSVTARIHMVKQPKGGYLSPGDLKETILPDDGYKMKEENVAATLVGIAVDYLTRMESGTGKEEAFKISLLGAAIVGEEDTAKELLNGISGLDELSVVNVLKLAGYDVNVRAGVSHYRSIREIQPDQNTVENVIVMVKRSLEFLKQYGPKVLDGFTFEGGYTDTVASGDGDFLTKDSLWDFKVSKRPPKKEYTLQILMYWRLGVHSVHSEFINIKKLGIFNPRLNRVYQISVDDIKEDAIKAVERDVIGYE